MLGLTKLTQWIFGSRNERLIKQYRTVVATINDLEAQYQALSDDELKGQTPLFKERVAAGESLDALLPEAFAVVRETASRVLDMRHFDVQLIGGMVLHDHKVAEMSTGEGKTLTVTLPAYLNALTGQSVHIVTVNDYLAKRDAEWMRPVFEALGLTVGINLTNMSTLQKRQAYAADITYGTNNEFGFDYLRDNMVYQLEDKVQRELGFVFIDEVDSILIDEARTPLIISGMSADSHEDYQGINRLIPRLTLQLDDEAPGDYTIDEQQKQAYLTEIGHQKVEALMSDAGLIPKGESIYAPAHVKWMHLINAGLRAHALYKRDVDYMVKEGEILIIDEHTGRAMMGRRWSEGLHQAIEAKEGVPIQQENQTMASITFQNYFRLYDKLSGMTGTADTEAYELHQIYGLEVVIIPTNLPCQRKDAPDLVYLTKKEKYGAIVQDIQVCLERQQPVLVGTASVEASEELSALLKASKIKHQVLNAKFHEKEAEIIAQAGRPGAVTIATNMAGRGTDIVLGGNLEAELATVSEEQTEAIAALKADWDVRHATVLEAGGLHVLGSERHESRRIDNQLRGRCGRQGDVGSSRFYLSLDDDLMRIFASERLSNMMRRLGLPEGEAIQHGLVSRAIESAQRKVEGFNFDVRKELLEFDDVANAQRQQIYEQRAELLESPESTAELLEAIRQDVLQGMVSEYADESMLMEQWDTEGFQKRLESEFNEILPLSEWVKTLENSEQLFEKIDAYFEAQYVEKVAAVGESTMRQFERHVLLQTLDRFWVEHLQALEHLRQGIHLRGYAQKDPKQEYKREAFELFSQLLVRLKQEVWSVVANVRIEAPEEVDRMASEAPAMTESSHPQGAGPMGQATETKVGRNQLCPCGSGKKYKRCHGKL